MGGWWSMGKNRESIREYRKFGVAWRSTDVGEIEKFLVVGSRMRRIRKEWGSVGRGVGWDSGEGYVGECGGGVGEV